MLAQRPRQIRQRRPEGQGREAVSVALAVICGLVYAASAAALRHALVLRLSSTPLELFTELITLQ